MDTRLLKYFESIVRNKNITKAAQELHISQPSLSKQIKVFEAELGCKLLERSTREITLLEPGKVLYKHAVKILQQIESANKEMEDVKNIGIGEISIGAFVTSIPWLCKVIPEFKKKYPNLSIKIKELGAKEITESLTNYDVHIGITSDIIHSDFLTFNPITEENLVLITPADHHFKDREEIDFIYLDGEPLIFFPKNYHTRELTMANFNQLNIKPNIAFETSRTSSIISLVSAGLGVALIFESHIKFSSKKDFNVIKVVNPTVKRTIYTAINQNRHLPALVHELHSLIVQLFKSNNQ